MKPLLMGALVTLAHIAVAVFLLAPEGPLSWRYGTLNQHDSYWFMNIVDRGYQTTLPPIDHKVMEVSNTAFFPGYPAAVSLFHHGFRLETETALLLAAQLSAFGFWCYFFLFCKRWGISSRAQLLGAMAIASHPAAFFLVAGYSESLFLMTLLGFIYWSSSDGRGARILAASHGFVMSATRIVGVLCCAIPLIGSVVTKGVRNFRQHFVAAIVCGVAGSGAALFFLYSQIRWGRWDIYMLTQKAGWGIVADYGAVFRPSSYRWLIPALDYPIEGSQMAMTLGGVMLLLVGLCEALPVVRRRTEWQHRIAIYFAAAGIYYISVSGVACVNMESMLRYEFCVHALIVLAFLHFLGQCRLPSLLTRALGPVAVVLASVAGLGLQAWYVWNFTRGHWIA